jgi:hypothetical protein
VVVQTTTVVSFFACVTVAFLLHLSFIFASNDGSATIGVVVFVAEGLGFVKQTLAIRPNNNRGTETQQSTTDFDANGNLLVLNNIGTLNWHYNNTLNQLTKVGVCLMISL